MSKFPNLEDAIEEHNSVTIALSKCGVTDYKRHSTAVKAVLSDAVQSNHLRIKLGDPLLRTESVNTDLNGNGVLPYSMLQQKRDQTYTVWDNTSNHMTMGNINASHWISDSVMLSGVTYARRNYTTTYNGDGNDSFGQAGEDDQGEVNRTYTTQQSQGAALQASWLTE